MRMYCNYHKHSDESNIYTPDSTILIEDYIKRTEELGHQIISTVEHGYVGNYFADYLKIEKENKKRKTKALPPLKWIFGGEFYFVKDRKTKDKSNVHIILLARNENGRKNINRIMSEANKTGYYFKPRIDLELIMSLPPQDVFITTACLSISKYKDIDNIILQLNEKFPHFYLEVQAHHVDKQRERNKHLLELSYKYNIPIIAGVDSHMIYESQAIERDDFLKSNNIFYEDEQGFFMDFPDGDTLFKRFQEQGVLSDKEIEIAMNNTNKVLEFEDIILDKSMKLPNIYKDLSQEERNQKLRDIVYEGWNKEKTNIPKDKQKYYEEQIEYELSEIFGCNMADYFLFNERVINLGIHKYNGVLTHSGRGSMVSEYINKTLGFTKVDRINSKITMYPERFLTKDRILKSHTPPDCDFNVSSREPFLAAQRELLGEKSCYDLLAFGTLKLKAAWKMYARAYDISPDKANEVSKQIDIYEKKLKYAERDENGELLEEINIEDFIEPKYLDLLEGCKKYLGIKTQRKGHPCASIVSSLNIEEEIGVILCKSESTKKETLTAVIESGTIDYFSWLKNDFLIVSVVKTTDEIYKRIGIPQYSVDELLRLVENDKKIWRIYENGWTLGINQVEQEGSKKKCMKYKPKNITELTCLIAGIRPSFKSLINKFLSREPFEYGIKEFDELLQTEEMPYSYIFYQEQLMKILEFAGFDMKDTYDIIKSISKKKTYCKDCGTTGNDGMKTCPICGSTRIAPLVDKYEEQFMEGFVSKISNHSEETAKEVWNIVLDFSKYGFNASHAYCMALDSVEGAYLKAYYPGEFYEVMLRTYTAKGEKNKVNAFKEEMKHFGIKLGKIEFGEDNRGFKYIPETNTITQNITAFKNINQMTADALYRLDQETYYENFIELLVDMKDVPALTKRTIEPLIEMGYFSKFGNIEYLKKCYKVFEDFYEKKQFSKTHEYSYIIKKYAKTETEKLYKDVDVLRVIYAIMGNFNKEVSKLEQIVCDFKRYGATDKTLFNFDNKVYIILNIDTKYSPKITLYNPHTGGTQLVKMNKKTFEQLDLKVYDCIEHLKVQRKKKTKKKGNNFVPVDGYDFWLNSCNIITKLS